MTAYRLYCFGAHGKTGHVDVLDATDDEDAVRKAYSRHLEVACEVWDGDRLVAHISAGQEQPCTL